VAKIVAEVDPKGDVLTICHSDYDLKIFARAKSSGKIFDKGHGLRLIKKKMKLHFKEGNILVCGDSETDLPMLEECLNDAPQNVYTIWVTKDEALKKKVLAMCSRFANGHVVFVSCPEVLLGAMASATVRELHIRPPGFDDDDFEELI